MWKGEPGAPEIGWLRRWWRGRINLGEPSENCERCGLPIRYVNVLVHPNWNGSVRVGNYCAERMSRRGESAAKDLLHSSCANTGGRTSGVRWLSSFFWRSFGGEDGVLSAAAILAQLDKSFSLVRPILGTGLPRPKISE